jgi:hypothetical protein
MNKSLIIILLLPLTLLLCCKNTRVTVTDEIFCGHWITLDDQQKLVPWYTPAENAFDHFLDLRWNFIKTRVPNSPGPAPRSEYPLYYFYSAFSIKDGIPQPDAWMNDIGEKIPNWFESARLYYAYTGDTTVINIIRKFVDYALKHGTSSYDFAWPGFPYTTTNSGDTIFRGFTSAGRFSLHEVHVDHAGEMGFTYYRMYLLTGNRKYLAAALNVADVLVKHSRSGNGEESVLPYRVRVDSGRVTAPYGANWTGCYMLLKSLSRDGQGNTTEYRKTCDMIKAFLLSYPMKTGYWTDGHTDTDVKSNIYKSNLSASNMTLCLFDYPDLDPDWKSDIPKLIKWTEDYFIFRSAPNESSTMWGANIAGEQDSFNFKMDYQTARYAAACARWYAISGDKSYKEKAYRSLNWVTYCNDSAGMAFESPVSKGILSWWSDCYGECPRMFYQAFAAVPDWAPPREDHILYSEGILRGVQYGKKLVKYTASADNGVVYLRLSFRPGIVAFYGKDIPESTDLMPDTYLLRKLGKGDYALTIRHSRACDVLISG